MLCFCIKNNHFLNYTKARILKNEYFGIMEHQILYNIIVELSEAMDSFDRHIVEQRIYEKDLLSAIDKKILTKILLTESSESVAKESVRTIVELYGQRVMAEALADIQDKLSKGNITPNDIISQLSSVQMYDKNDESRPQRIGEIKFSEDDSPTIKTLLKRRDDGWYRRKNITIIAGRPAMGKTTFAIQDAWQVAKQGEKVYFVSLEMSKKEMVSKIYDIEHDTDSLSDMSEAKKTEILNEFTEELVTQDFIIEDEIGASIDKVISNIKYEHNIKPVDIVFVDHIQYFLGESTNENGHKIITEVSKKLKVLANELDCAVVILSQLSRGIDYRDNKRPLLTDLKESGSLEQDACLVIMLYRAEYYGIRYEENRSTAGLAIAITRKNRFGLAPAEKAYHFGTGVVEGNTVKNVNKAYIFRNFEDIEKPSTNNNNNKTKGKDDDDEGILLKYL